MEANKKIIGRWIAAAAFVCSSLGCYVTNAFADFCQVQSSSWSAYACCTSPGGYSGCSTGDTVGSSTYVKAWGDSGETGCQGRPYNWIGDGLDQFNNVVCEVTTAGTTASSSACSSGGTHTEITFRSPVC